MRIDEVYVKNFGPFEEQRILFEKGVNPKLADVYLLTGPNGSGKSSLLYGIAGVIAFGDGSLGANLSLQRFRDLDSTVALRSNDAVRAIAYWNRLGQARHTIPDPFHEGHLDMRLSAGESLSAFANLAAMRDTERLHKYYEACTFLNQKMTAPVHLQFDWAAFAYAGMRSVSATQVPAIEEPKESPLNLSLSFNETANTQQLAAWIANQEFKKLKARDRGSREKEIEITASIQRIESVISEIVEAEFRFESGIEDNNVRIKWDGRVCEFGVLPDGLKSIMSWIADFLMRLDRIKWRNDTPHVDRHFLLLLDEIDVHLHPSWQRKVLPVVQRLFPNAQIIASTHSPFVVSSVEDVQIISMKIDDGIASVDSIQKSHLGWSYGAVLNSIFGIKTDFDFDTERLFGRFREAKAKLLSGESTDKSAVLAFANELRNRSEELAAIIAIEMRQMDRQLQGNGLPQ